MSEDGAADGHEAVYQSPGRPPRPDPLLRRGVKSGCGHGSAH